VTHARVVRLAVACLAGTAATLIVAGSTSADPSARHDFSAVALAIPVTPGTNADENTTRIETAGGHRPKIDTVATSSLNCDGCTAYSSTLHVVYAPRPDAVEADNVATAWSSGCAGCSGWALSVQIVVARSAGSVTAANSALAFTTGCTNCAVNAAAVQMVFVAPHERRLTSRQLDAIQAQYRNYIQALGGAASPSRARTQAAPQAATNQATTTITATTQRIRAAVAADLQATSSKYTVKVR
jgi:hypothetical protein